MGKDCVLGWIDRQQEDLMEQVDFFPEKIFLLLQFRLEPLTAV